MEKLFLGRYLSQVTWLSTSSVYFVFSTYMSCPWGQTSHELWSRDGVLESPEKPVPPFFLFSGILLSEWLVMWCYCGLRLWIPIWVQDFPASRLPNGYRMRLNRCDAPWSYMTESRLRHYWPIRLFPALKHGTFLSKTHDIIIKSYKRALALAWDALDS